MKRVILFYIFFLFPVTFLTAQSRDDELTVKGSLIFRLSEYFSWPKEASLNKFVVAVYADDESMFAALTQISKNKKIKGKPVVIQKINAPDNLKGINILYLNKERSENPADIYNALKGKNILLFTDGCGYPGATMINFFLNKEDKISFEINKKNLESNKFSVPNELLVLGGSQLEIKAAFDEAQKTLKDLQDKIKQQQKEIDAQKKIIAEQKIQSESQKTKINSQNDEIASQRKVYNELRARIDSTQKVLLDETATLEEQKNKIEMRDITIKKQGLKIDSQIAVLSRQKSEIVEGKKEVEEQKETVVKQISQIDTQKNVIYLSAVFVTILFLLSIAVIRSNRINKRINKQLLEKNSQIELQKQDLEDRKRQLEIANSELESFSYSVSHDLRAPLRIIDGYGNIVINEYSDQLDEEALGFLGKIISSSKKMALLIDDLLKLSKVTRQAIVKEKLNFSSLARNEFEELKVFYPDKKIELLLQENITAEADARLLRIVLKNLIDNAMKFSYKRDNPVVEIGAVKENGKNVYYVKDNGAGFDMKESERLFKAFHRLHEENEFPGTGIGLTIVKRIINRHGGYIKVESALNSGTAVLFTLS